MFAGESIDGLRSALLNYVRRRSELLPYWIVKKHIIIMYMRLALTAWSKIMWEKFLNLET